MNIYAFPLNLGKNIVIIWESACGPLSSLTQSQFSEARKTYISSFAGDQIPHFMKEKPISCSPGIRGSKVDLTLSVFTFSVILAL